VIGKLGEDPIKVLLVEDNLGDARLLHESLKNAQNIHINFLHVMNVNDAIDQIKGRSFDVVLLDLSLPDSQGIKTIHRMLQAAPDIPIVVLTGLDNEEMGIQAVQSGAQDYLVKGDADIKLIVRVLRYAIERKRNEVELKEARNLALEAAWLKSEFLTNMGHELRTPINGIMGMAGILIDSGLSEEQKQFAELVLSSADSLHRIINDILDFSNIELSKLKLDTFNFDLGYVVKSVVDTYAERAKSKDLDLVALINKNVHTSLRGDPGRLRQVLTNLIRNAIQFTEHGHIVINVTKDDETALHETILFTIKDTGVGISATVQRQIFQSFKQADGSLTRKHGGAGLGLALCRQIIELMGGEIGVESEEGKGATFWFKLKFEKQTGNVGINNIERAELKGIRALVVDNIPASREVTRLELSACGMVISEAEDAQTALQMLREAVASGKPFELAIIDLHIPDADGFELARMIKSDKTIANTRLVLLPFIGQRGHGEAARELGISAYLIRPVKHAQLSDCLEIVMSKEFDDTVSGQANNPITRHSLEEAQLSRQNSVLVISDDITKKKNLVSLLASLSHGADVVSNEMEALEVVAQNSYSLILIYADTRRKDKYIAHIKDLKRKATILVAIVDNEDEGAEFLKAGVDSALAEPVGRDDLIKILENRLNADKVPTTD
jgi:two-component system, sensor histidine kinase and response regulator